jgi:hypothetical protein
METLETLFHVRSIHVLHIALPVVHEETVRRLATSTPQSEIQDPLFLWAPACPSACTAAFPSVYSIFLVPYWFHFGLYT